MWSDLYVCFFMLSWGGGVLECCMILVWFGYEVESMMCSSDIWGWRWWCVRWFVVFLDWLELVLFVMGYLRVWCRGICCFGWFSVDGFGMSCIFGGILICYVVVNNVVSVFVRILKFCIICVWEESSNYWYGILIFYLYFLFMIVLLDYIFYFLLVIFYLMIM